MQLKLSRWHLLLEIHSPAVLSHFILITAFFLSILKTLLKLINNFFNKKKDTEIYKVHRAYVQVTSFSYCYPKLFYWAWGSGDTVDTIYWLCWFITAEFILYLDCCLCIRCHCLLIINIILMVFNIYIYIVLNV